MKKSEHIFYGGAGSYYQIERGDDHKKGWEPLTKTMPQTNTNYSTKNSQTTQIS
jgi:hypothetical protein